MASTTLLTFRTTPSPSRRSPHHDVSFRSFPQDSSSPLTESDAVAALLMGSTSNDCHTVEHGFRVEPCFVPMTSLKEESSLNTIDDPPMPQRRPRSGSEGLDYLAFFAEQERRASSDDEMMPPPQPRRPRSQSEDGFFVLPPSLLKKELEEARILAAANCRRSPTLSIPEDAEYVEDESNEYEEEDEEEEYEDDDNTLEEEVNDNVETISSTELLRRARSRLLEDMSESNLNGGGSNEKGFVILPHALSKYQSLYNKNGRVGIYTPQERAAIIARYHMKRLNRNWNKKIRYNCRKNLADRRLRVKGRFVKRTAEDLMPDVTDPEAGFCPTTDQPYRRLRRHTVT